MARTIIDFNILQTVPPSNINRDDTGSPKTAVFGGVRRARVSSQAWKRATRVAFQDTLDKSDLGTRTKQIIELLIAEIKKADAAISGERAEELAKEVFGAAGIKLTKARKSTPENPIPDEAGYLLFLSARQIARLTELAVEANGADDVKAHLKAAGVKKALDDANSIDVSLFGRMVADSSDLNVDAAAQVAHALSVHAVENEFDYFTAVDDHKNADEEEDAGAGMIGTVEFNSSTLYRYATVDADRLLDNLGDATATRRAVEAFAQAFVRSLPTGKQNTFANRTLPDAVVISIRDTQPVNLVGAFETAIKAADGGRIKAAADALAEYAAQVDRTYSTNPVKTWVIRISPATAALDALADGAGPTPLDGSIDELGALVATRLSDAHPSGVA